MDITPSWRFMVGRLLALRTITDGSTCPEECEWVDEQFARIGEHLDGLAGGPHALPMVNIRQFQKAESAALSA